MKRIMIIGGAIVGALIVVVVVAGIFLVANLDSVVKRVIEEAGSRMAGAPVRVESVSISLESGSGRLDGLTIGNPPGFSDAIAFSARTVSLSLDITSLRGSPVVVREILIDQPAARYEFQGQSSNFSTLAQNARDHAGGGESAGADAGSGQALVIDSLRIENGQIAVAAPALTDQTLSTALPPVRLTGIGRDRGGLAPAEVAQIVLLALAESARTAAASTSLQDLTGGAEGAVDRLRGVIEEGAEEAGSGLGGALKGLLGGQ
ncbi:MAG: hypothetical protein RIE31_02630 [Alphaproteobacteria bacterium]